MDRMCIVRLVAVTRSIYQKRCMQDCIGDKCLPILFAIIQLLHELGWRIADVQRYRIILFAFDEALRFSVGLVHAHRLGRLGEVNHCLC